jgi:glutathionylspermidine synthase
MRRITIQPRPNLQQRANELGFAFHTIGGKRYWDETAYYTFTLDQIERDIEDPTTELASLCLELVARVVGDEAALTRLQIPQHAWELIAQSWRRGDPSLYGRFDLAYDGTGPAKMLEYNADTPTALFEASVFQWVWLEDVVASRALPASADQFNSIHETLVARFAHLRAVHKTSRTLHLTCVPGSEEDRGFITYLAQCAGEAGLKTELLAIGDIGSRGTGPFVDLANNPIHVMFKLYPWEWMLDEKFGRDPAMRHTRFIEPPWKAILSNKGILPLLWEMAPGHPNLLPAFFEDDPDHVRTGPRFAKKPLYSREGSNILLADGDRVLDRDGGPYGRGGYVRQALATIPNCDGNYPVIGSWVIGDKACGIGLREDSSMITKNTSRFVPHAIIG